MKISTLLISLLIYSGTVFAENNCTSELQSIEDQIIPVAESLVSHKLPIKVVLTTDTFYNTIGYADSNNNTIYFLPYICNHVSTLAKEMLLAHETGHIVAHNLWPRVKVDAYKQVPEFGRNIHEGLADQYAASILQSLGLLNSSIDALTLVCNHNTSNIDLESMNSVTNNSCEHLNTFKLALAN
jgi:hypothetical protein